MILLTKDLIVKVKDDIEKGFEPKNVTFTEWYEVIGINSWSYKDDKGKIQTVIKFIIINDKLELSFIAYHNCLVSIKGTLNRTMPFQKEKPAPNETTNH